MRGLLLLGVVFAVPFANAADPPKAKPPGKGVSYAFLVAAAEYDKNELRPLPYSGKETAEFRDVLLKTGFDEANVKMLHDKAERRYLPTRKQIADELDLLLGRAEPDDTVVVLLNGHGVHFSGDATGYFCPVDARLSDKTTLVPMDGKGGVFELLKACKAKRKVLLVNACRNDPRSDLSLAGDRIKLDDEDKDEVPEGIAALYSCRPGERSYYYDPTDAKSKGRERSLYMHHLIEAWGKGENTTLEDVFAAVRRGTVTDADALFARKQTPLVRREYKGEGEWVIGSQADTLTVADPGLSFTDRGGGILVSLVNEGRAGKTSGLVARDIRRVTWKDGDSSTGRVAVVLKIEPGGKSSLTVTDVTADGDGTRSNTFIRANVTVADLKAELRTLKPTELVVEVVNEVKGVTGATIYAWSLK